MGGGGQQTSGACPHGRLSLELMGHLIHKEVCALATGGNAGGGRALATSRRGLGLRQEHALALAPAPHADFYTRGANGAHRLDLAKRVHPDLGPRWGQRSPNVALADKSVAAITESAARLSKAANFIWEKAVEWVEAHKATEGGSHLGVGAP